MKKPYWGVARNGQLYDRWNKARQGCCGKIAYSSEANAAFARDNNAERNPGDHVHYYQCRRGAWHLSTHEYQPRSS